MVHPEGKLPKILLIRSGETGAIIRITRRNVFEQLDDSSIGSSGPQRSAGNGCRVSLKNIALDSLLVGAKEESLVATVVKGRASFAESWPEGGDAEGPAKLIALELVLPGSVPWSGIEGRVPQKLKRVSMELVGTGFSDAVYHSPGVLAVLRAVVARLHAEFLKRVRHRKWLVNIRILVDVIAAIELVADL